MMITKTALPRRTFLRGIGTTLALPSSTRWFQRCPREPRTRPPSDSSTSERRHPDHLGAGDDRRELRALADSEPAGAGSRPPARAERARTSAGRLSATAMAIIRAAPPCG